MSYVDVLTLIHTAISLVAIGAGVVAVLALMRNSDLRGWTHLFLVTAFLTSATGFLFPFSILTPAMVVGLIALAILALVVLAFYKYNSARTWRWVHAIGMVASLYLLVFVGVVQAFQKIAYLNGFAPTQSELPFVVAQVATLFFFVVLGVAAVRAYHPTTA
jgi:hypothetical protein